MRQQIFKANKARIKEINSNPVNTFRVGVNKFADLDPQEYREKLFKSKRSHRNPETKQQEK